MGAVWKHPWIRDHGRAIYSCRVPRHEPDPRSTGERSRDDDGNWIGKSGTMGGGKLESERSAPPSLPKCCTLGKTCWPFRPSGTTLDEHQILAVLRAQLKILPDSRVQRSVRATVLRATGHELVLLSLSCVLDIHQDVSLRRDLMARLPRRDRLFVVSIAVKSAYMKGSMDGVRGIDYLSRSLSQVLIGSSRDERGYVRYNREQNYCLSDITPVLLQTLLNSGNKIKQNKMQDGGTEAFWARVDDIACARLNAEGKPGPEFAGIRRHAQDLLHRSRGIPVKEDHVSRSNSDARDERKLRMGLLRRRRRYRAIEVMKALDARHWHAPPLIMRDKHTRC
ncbi:hypothetical protein DFH94DRAFT_846894 [Russula ochroleuca]|uniref:Uncharacterized protein n=1 Tax=Russula ochroleuca TaxID=152965 RepID=A0A9P5MRC1_9AGAM|nr:hypothetical protein DFH94DRAFT_846894 [Russula ochroleuca]